MKVLRNMSVLPSQGGGVHMMTTGSRKKHNTKNKKLTDKQRKKQPVNNKMHLLQVANSTACYRATQKKRKEKTTEKNKKNNGLHPQLQLLPELEPLSFTVRQTDHPGVSDPGRFGGNAGIHHFVRSRRS